MSQGEIGASNANWFPDPTTPGQERYWDGAAWTAHVRPQAFQHHSAVPMTSASTSSALSVTAIILGAVAFLILPPLFGTAGLVIGAVAKSRNEPLAVVGMVVSGVGLVVGMMLGVMAMSATL